MLGKLFSSLHQKGQKTIIEGCSELKRGLPKVAFIDTKEKNTTLMSFDDGQRPRQMDG